MSAPRRRLRDATPRGRILAALSRFKPFGALLDAIETGAAPKIALALAIGTVGALVADALHVPLAFMLGALFATMGASFLKAPVLPSLRLRINCFVIIGLYLSEGFTEEVVAAAAGWWPSLFLAMVYPVVIGALCFYFYVRAGAMSRADALFSGVPGGLSGIVLVSGAFGADEGKVALSHALRVAMIVLAAPAFFFGVLGYSEPSLAVAEENLISWGDAGILAAAAIAAIYVASRLGVPLPQLIAPLAVGATFRSTGIIEGAMPELLVEAALVVVGASIGARFVGARLRDLGALAVWTLLGTALMVAGSIVFALAATATTDATIFPAILAFAPGGVAEMTLISIALESDPAYVAAHHLVRLGFIMLATPFVAPRLTRMLGVQRTTMERGAAE